MVAENGCPEADECNVRSDLATTSTRCWESSRRGKGGVGREVAKFDAGSDGHWYDGMETGDDWVGK